MVAAALAGGSAGPQADGGWPLSAVGPHLSTGMPSAGGGVGVALQGCARATRAPGCGHIAWPPCTSDHAPTSATKQRKIRIPILIGFSFL